MSLTLKPSPIREQRPMGEAKVKVRLTNALDESLCGFRQLPSERVRSREASALVDTGAVRSVVPQSIVEELGLAIRGQRIAEYADGRKEPVPITGPLIVEVLGRDTIEEALVLGDEVLIGQTVLEKLDLLVDCLQQCLMPNPAHPDQPVTKVKALMPAR
jgi:clan AA aspartic protease